MKLHVKLVGYNLDGLWHKVARLAALQRKRERRFDLHLTLGGRVGSEVNSTNPEIVVCIYACTYIYIYMMYKHTIPS